MNQLEVGQVHGARRGRVEEEEEEKVNEECAVFLLSLSLSRVMGIGRDFKR